MAVKAGPASTWRRGRLLGEVAQFSTGLMAKFFLENTGQVTGLLDVASAVRSIPKDLARATSTFGYIGIGLYLISQTWQPWSRYQEAMTS